MYDDISADWRKVVQDFRVCGAHIDTTVAHRMAKVVVPISGVKAVILEKVGDPRDIGEVIKVTARFVATGHGLAGCFEPHFEGARHGWV